MVGLIALVNLAALVIVLLLLDAVALLAVVNLTLVLAFWKGCMHQLFQN